MINKILIVISFFVSGFLQAQNAKDVFEAFRGGDVETVVKAMDRDIELCFDDNVEFMDKKQAAFALKAFFKRNPPMSFKRLHNGNSMQSKYVIARYRSSNGNNFRVYIFAKQGQENFKIQELRFDKV